LVTLRSTMKSAIPMRIRIAPTLGVITIAGGVLPERARDGQVTLTSLI
jgi:hypothetical protein